jgi:hypothetical protein
MTLDQIADLFQKTPQNIALHIRAIYEEGELREDATCKEYLQVRQEGSRQVSRRLKHYHLNVIRAVGYRVRSPRGTQFRQWLTAQLAGKSVGLHAGTKPAAVRAQRWRPRSTIRAIREPAEAPCGANIVAGFSAQRNSRKQSHSREAVLSAAAFLAGSQDVRPRTAGQAAVRIWPYSNSTRIETGLTP